MKNILALLVGLVGILAVATSLTAEATSNSNSRRLKSEYGAGESGAAAVSSVSKGRAQKPLNRRAGLPVAALGCSSALSIDRPLNEPLKPTVPLWLSELNQWRHMVGLHLVAENSRLSYGSKEHARYLIVQGPANLSEFRAYDRSIGPAAHLESSHNRSYTTAGAQAAIGGPIAVDVIQAADVAWEGRTESGDIDNLIAAPFHRLTLLAPWAENGGYGSFGEYPRRVAALALRGPVGALHRAPIEFPPANTRISISMLRGSEWPNPIASCAAYERTVGLPVTLQTGGRLLLRFYSLRDQTSGRTLDACGFDAFSYCNSNELQRQRARELLNAFGAAVIIPREPLLPKHQYGVVMQTSQGRFEWSFKIEKAAEIEPAQVQQKTIRQVAARH